MPGSLADRLARSFRYTGAMGVVLTVVLVALYGYTAAVIHPDETRYTLGSRAVRLAHAAMIDQETGLRGYLLVHQPVFLQPYTQGKAALATENADIDHYLSGDRSVDSLIVEMLVTEQQWITEWADRVVAGNAPTNQAALAAFVLRGKGLFDTYRTREEAVADEVDSRRNTFEDREGLAIAAALVAVVVLGTALLAVMVVQYRRLKRAVVEPVSAILTAAGAIAAGDFTSRADESGPLEFSRIAAGLNQTASSLATMEADARARGAIVERQAAQLRQILVMAREIAGSLSLRYVLRATASTTAEVGGLARVVIWLVDDGGQTLTAAYDSATSDGDPRDLAPAQLGIGVVGQAARYGRTATEAEGDEPAVEVHPERPMRALAIPLVVGARIRGAIELTNPEPYLMPEGSLEVLETLAIHAAAAIEAARLHREAEHLGLTDALTGLPNRRSLDRDLDVEWERTIRYQRPIALIMLDVDHFKRFNDTYGHQRGDEVLQEVGSALRVELRSTDSAYRFGGEEFVIVARETIEPEATNLAERLRSGLERHFRGHGSVGPVTASFGVVAGPRSDCLAVEELLGLADDALYRAKREGRNRVRVAPPVADDRSAASPTG